MTPPDVADVRFLLLPLPDFALLPFASFLDKLRFSADDEDYSRQRYCRWTIAGLAAGSIRASCGALLQVEHALAELDPGDYDYLVLFGSRQAGAMSALAPGCQSLLRGIAARGVKLVSIDNACFLLAACGLLDGYRVAVHWRHVAEFQASFPRVRLVPEALYLQDGARLSCAGGTAAIDLAVALLGRHSGRERALKGLADMLVDDSRGSRHALRSLDGAARDSGPLGRAIAQMRDWLAGPHHIERLARAVGISRRQLDRLFHAGHGMSTSDYWLEMRLQHVRWRLLNSPHSLATLADEVGAADSSYLGKLFRRRFGLTPGACRRQAGALPQADGERAGER